jgi:hypothetical protein
VVADVRDPSIALMMNRRLVGAATLQIAVADEFHVLALRLRLCERGFGRVSRNQNAKHNNASPYLPRAKIAQHGSSRFESAAGRGWLRMREKPRKPNSNFRVSILMVRGPARDSRGGSVHPKGISSHNFESDTVLSAAAMSEQSSTGFSLWGSI